MLILSPTEIEKPEPPVQIEKVVLPPWVGLKTELIPATITMRRKEFQQMLANIHESDALIDVIKWQVQSGPGSGPGPSQGRGQEAEGAHTDRIEPATTVGLHSNQLALSPESKSRI